MWHLAIPTCKWPPALAKALNKSRFAAVGLSYDGYRLVARAVMIIVVDNGWNGKIQWSQACQGRTAGAGSTNHHRWDGSRVGYEFQCSPNPYFFLRPPAAARRIQCLSVATLSWP